MNKYYVARGYHLSEDDAPRQPAAHDRSWQRGWEETVTDYRRVSILSSALMSETLENVADRQY